MYHCPKTPLNKSELIKLTFRLIVKTNLTLYMNLPNYWIGIDFSRAIFTRLELFGLWKIQCSIEVNTIEKGKSHTLYKLQPLQSA